jgi:hypothetical protein
MGFNLENYEPVAERLVRAHAQYPDLRVITDLVHAERDDSGKPIQYIVRAQIWVGEVLKAQDYAEEMVGSSNVNKTSALENCSTSAIGRALADMGFQGSINGKPARPSREEMEKVERAEKEPTYTNEQVNDAIEATLQVATINDLTELKMFFDGAKSANLISIPINGTTLGKMVANRKKELEK